MSVRQSDRRSRASWAALVLGLASAATLCAARPQDRPLFSASRGDTTIDSDLVVPAGGGSHPYVVLIPDASDGRPGLVEPAALAQALARRGVASATVHRRTRRHGVIEDPTQPEELALNAVAVAAQLAARPDLSGRHGYVGLGLSGAMAPRMGLRDDRAAFLVNIEGTTLPGREQLAYQIDHAADPSRRDLADVTLDYLAGRASWDAYQSVRNRFPGGTTDSLPPDTEGDRYWSLWRGFVDYDPMRDWIRSTVPALVVYRSGQVENPLPVTQCLARLLDSVVLHSQIDVKILSLTESPVEIVADWIGRRVGATGELDLAPGHQVPR